MQIGLVTSIDIFHESHVEKYAHVACLRALHVNQECHTRSGFHPSYLCDLVGNQTCLTQQRCSFAATDLLDVNFISGFKIPFRRFCTSGVPDSERLADW